MDDRLTTDEYDALEELRKGRKPGRVSARVARNAARLTALKYLESDRKSGFRLTPKGEQVLFVKRCIDGLRAVSLDPLAPLSNDVVTFLGRKGHIVASPSGEGYELTPRGAESLADIDSTKR